MLVRAKEAYKLWHEYLENIKRIDRYTIGVTIDNTFVALLETLFRATFAYDKFEKLSLVGEATGKCDLLRFFLQIAWEHKIVGHGTYGKFILLLDEVGRMLGGWKKSLADKTPTRK